MDRLMHSAGLPGNCLRSMDGSSFSTKFLSGLDTSAKTLLPVNTFFHFFYDTYINDIYNQYTSVYHYSIKEIRKSWFSLSSYFSTTRIILDLSH